MRNPLGVKLVSEITKYIEIDINDMKNIFGQFDHYIKKIEKELQVMVIDRDGQVKVSGEENRVEKACKLLEEFIEMSKRGNMGPTRRTGSPRSSTHNHGDPRVSYP